MVVSLALSASAKSLRDMWIAMPDSLVPTLDANMRLEMVELHDMQVKAEVKSLLDSDCVLDTLTSDYLQVATSKAAFVQMKMLPQVGGDSILCMVKTFAAPEKESDVRFYRQDWSEITPGQSQMFSIGNLSSLPNRLVAKPDTMSESRFEELKLMVEPKMYSAELSIRDNSIIFQLSLPLVSNDEKKHLNAILMQRKFKWNGEMFNEI